MVMIDLDLRLEQNFAEAGSLMKGRVDLSIRFRTEASSGIHLVLAGEEVTSIKCSESTSKGGAPDEPPKFDVLAKTIEYAKCKDFDQIMTYYAVDYVFRGPVVGPITAEDVRKTSEVSGIF